MTLLSPSTPVATAQADASTPAHAVTVINGYSRQWWKEAVVYQIYPRSFQDSNGDGIGDLNGITSRLDYLQKLGINVIWLSPHFDSPNADNGYDIRDYRKVMTEFGTMADFDRMLAGIKQRHMRLIIDLVVNHTSDEHRWFQESRKSRTNPYRDYYIWRDGRPNPSAPHGFDPPNNYPSYFSGSAWQWDDTTKQFYLHLFAVKQPDLNWENPKVRQEVYSLMRFWLDKGVDGFRMDVIPLISKIPGLPDLSPEQLKDPSKVWANGPRRDEFLQEMNREVLSKYDDMSVGEAIGIGLAETHNIVGEDRHELSEIFNFDATRIGAKGGYEYAPLNLPDLKAIYSAHARVLGKQDWDTVFLGNHDMSRVVSRWGDVSTPENRALSAKMLQTMVLTLRGTAYLYQGDELGMTNYPWTKISEFNDIEVQNRFKTDVASGRMTEQQLIQGAAAYGRDNSRTPMQWDTTKNAGFSSGTKTWQPVNPNYTTINAASQVNDPDSIYSFNRQMIALRHSDPAFVYGDYQDLDPKHQQVFIYTRTLGSAKYLVVLNFSKQPVEYSLPGGSAAGQLKLGNYRDTSDAPGSSTLHLRPWESRVYRQ
ncbi:alpha,alpha-phosphotrehalase [Terriglobus aquaticus]|uniref:Alpha,alpha-phosphotrehalase n=1 Tax=Terriglobus aquaticus TaxID=940139 RepID=A0ABW9KM16_9BACT|nr:alpha,alpha-phosphotrehalase [Terriglobus aquaticus]